MLDRIKKCGNHLFFLSFAVSFTMDISLHFNKAILMFYGMCTTNICPIDRLALHYL